MWWPGCTVQYGILIYPLLASKSYKPSSKCRCWFAKVSFCFIHPPPKWNEMETTSLCQGREVDGGYGCELLWRSIHHPFLPASDWVMRCDLLHCIAFLSMPLKFVLPITSIHFWEFTMSLQDYDEGGSYSSIMHIFIWRRIASWDNPIQSYWTRTREWDLIWAHAHSRQQLSMIWRQYTYFTKSEYGLIEDTVQ